MTTCYENSRHRAASLQLSYDMWRVLNRSYRSNGTCSLAPKQFKSKTKILVRVAIAAGVILDHSYGMLRVWWQGCSNMTMDKLQLVTVKHDTRARVCHCLVHSSRDLHLCHAFVLSELLFRSKLILHSLCQINYFVFTPSVRHFSSK